GGPVAQVVHPQVQQSGFACFAHQRQLQRRHVPGEDRDDVDPHDPDSGVADRFRGPEVWVSGSSRPGGGSTITVPESRSTSGTMSATNGTSDSPPRGWRTTKTSWAGA